MLKEDRFGRLEDLVKINPIKIEPANINFSNECPEEKYGCSHGNDIMHVNLGSRCWDIRRQRYE